MKLRGDQEGAHDDGGGGEQAAGAPDAARRVFLGVVGRALDLGHDGDAGFEAGQAQGQFREDQQGDTDDHQRVSVLRFRAGHQSPPRPGG